MPQGEKRKRSGKADIYAIQVHDSKLMIMSKWAVSGVSIWWPLLWLCERTKQKLQGKTFISLPPTLQLTTSTRLQSKHKVYSHGFSFLKQRGRRIHAHMPSLTATFRWNTRNEPASPRISLLGRHHYDQFIIMFDRTLTPSSKWYDVMLVEMGRGFHAFVRWQNFRKKWSRHWLHCWSFQHRLCLWDFSGERTVV